MIISPHMASGTAGGHDIAGEAQILPAASPEGILSCFEKTASRIVMTCTPIGGAETGIVGIFSGCSRASAFSILEISSSVLSGVSIRTTAELSANSHSISKFRKYSAAALPLQAIEILKGSSPIREKPRRRSFDFSRDTFSASLLASSIPSSRYLLHRSREASVRYDGLVEPNRARPFWVF